MNEINSARAAFDAAYDAVLRQWPATVETLNIPSSYGRTRVHACGPADGPPVLLLAGGGATSAVWSAQAAGLGRTHRVYAVDLVGDAGRSRPGDRPVRTREDLMAWLDEVLAGLATAGVDVCGHSYGGWIALRYALHAPERVRRLALLDPTVCFAGFSPRYLLRALPLLVRPNARRQLALLAWETGDAAPDPTWLTLASLGADLPRSGVVMPRRPGAEELRALSAPTLVLVAGRSRAHRPGRVADRARTLLPHATVEILPAETHHSIPTHDPDRLTDRLAAFLTAPGP